MVACTSQDSNTGIIKGLEDSNFVAHQNRGIFIPNSSTRLINNRTEMIEWYNEVSRQPNDDVFVEYCDEFFVYHQLIFISFWGRPRDITEYVVRSIEYSENTLNIQFVTARRIGTVIDLAQSRRAIIEITRIRDDLMVTFSHRDR
ncbi:MAG: hypothetical protein FWE36_08505 [Erysipelotrichales bacterium]|nr:hypothetical protein [Erysipelotrichales bacterium]